MNLSAETQSGTGSIHCYVSTADNGNFLSCNNRGIVIVAECLHQVVSRQVLIRREDSVCILTRDSHETRKSCTRTDEDCLKAFLIHQIVDRHRFSDHDIGLNLNTEFLYVLHLTADNRGLRQTELRNAVSQYSARLMKCLKDRHIVTQLCEITCTGQTGRTGTDYCNLDAILLLRCLRNEAMLSRPVSYKTLQLTDGDRLTLDTANTLALTLALLRAHTSTDCRKCGRLCDHICCSLVVSLLYLCDESRNVDRNRASVYAVWLLTL